jgi:cytochrome c2
MSKKLFTALLFLVLGHSVFASSADWGPGVRIPEGENRANIYELPTKEFKEQRREGFIHAVQYPVEVTGLFIPYQPLVNFFDPDRGGLRDLILRLTTKKMGFSSIQEMYDWIGLNPFNDEDAQGIYKIPYPNGKKPSLPMGATLIDTPKGKGITFSCATCHTANLFGTSIMGLTNKTVRANAFFHQAKTYVPKVPSWIFQKATGATDKEKELFKRTKDNLHSVGAKVPQVLGLDTSLPQVALSLARRGDDEFARKSRFRERFPRYNKLSGAHIADSKPMPWWNLKYKTRWLADGSIVSGNPVLTNFLWNEIGRGTDLEELEDWMKRNKDTIQELTVAAFSTEPPPWGDFFDVKKIDLPRAKSGQRHFENTCKKCHGTYQKGWESQNSDELTVDELVATTKVIYHEETPVKDVGTDPGRYQGMKYFSERLNELKISKWMNTVVEPQEGYVPPPLVGLWSRYPYLHNNAIPNLCALLTPPGERPKTFWQGSAKNKKTDFTQECVGYPTGDAVPQKWKEVEDAKFDTSREGLSNGGHYRMLLNKDGTEKYSWSEKMELIEYLKTL